MGALQSGPAPRRVLATSITTEFMMSVCMWSSATRHRNSRAAKALISPDSTCCSTTAGSLSRRMPLDRVEWSRPREVARSVTVSSGMVSRAFFWAR